MMKMMWRTGNHVSPEGRQRRPPSSRHVELQRGKSAERRALVHFVSPVVGTINRIVDVRRIVKGPFPAADLIELAQRRTGLRDFGDPCFKEPLETLTRSYREEADLSVFGLMTARWDVLRFLSNLLWLRQIEKEIPSIHAEVIRQPIFITGMPRSGTTFLHALLCEDHSNRAVQCWETICPYPARNGRPENHERRQRSVDRQLAIFGKMAPELKSLHPISARSPQECTEVTGHVFRSLRFDTTHHVPSYRLWLDNAGHVAAYRFHARFLKHLQHCGGAGTWILKCPDHVFALSAIREVYPDARFIFLHRNPLEVLASVARLTEVLRRPFTRQVDRFQIGQQVRERWEHGAAILIETAQSGAAMAERVCHVSFCDLARDPLACVTALYEHLGLTLSEDTAARMRRFVLQRPNGGYNQIKARLEDYGFDAGAERHRFRDYMSCFGL